MGDLVQFPTGKILKANEEIKSKSDQEYEKAMDAVDIAIRMFVILQQAFVELDDPELKDLNFTDPNCLEAQDMYVIINLISSMIIRHYGINHQLHPYMEDLYEIIVEQLEQ